MENFSTLLHRRLGQVNFYHGSHLAASIEIQLGLIYFSRVKKIGWNQSGARSVAGHFVANSTLSHYYSIIVSIIVCMHGAESVQLIRSV